MRKAFEDRHGVQYDVNNFLTNLIFADDSAIFTNTDTEATDIFYHIAHIAQSYGLRINADKTKVMMMDGSQANIHLNGVQIEQVQEFKYLGLLVQEKKVASTTKVHSRIGQATAAFALLK
uniref:Reverse transcriptase domain-containing protein n=1 Tax=Plectus sambesii TaxID=2011161 RepID=A0A914X7K8_9BILA